MLLPRPYRLSQTIFIFNMVAISSTVVTAQAAENWTFAGYLETYFIADGNRAGINQRPDFVYSHNRSHEFSVNLALLEGHYHDDNVRATVGIGAGSYMNANYADEPDTLKNLFAAYVGVKLSQHHNLWLDVGVMPSHIGFESAIGQQNWTLTRSIMADNSPYFETGAKITYTTDDGVWTVAALALNGWQRIERLEGNEQISFGHQITFTPNDSFTVNSSSFIGSDTADERKRWFHNLYATWSLTSDLAFTLAFDYGQEERGVEQDGNNEWWSSTLVSQYKVSDRWVIAGRIEHYKDTGGVIIAAPENTGFAVTAASVNADYQISHNVWWRNEWRYFSNDDAIFLRQDTFARTDTMFTTALTFSFH